MQKIWSRILAGEANTPGKFSKRTVNFMASLDKEDAELFTKLCSFVWGVGVHEPLIYDTKENLYLDHGINFANLEHLGTIGLINFNELGYQRDSYPKKILATYRNNMFIIEFRDEKGNVLEIGKARFTRVGSELASICQSELVNNFDLYIMKRWMKSGIKLYCEIKK